MSMIEKVAAAIDKHMPDQPTKEDIREAARAAVEALREPSEAILNAADECKRESNKDFPPTEFESAIDPSGEEYWRAMIDAILSEK